MNSSEGFLLAPLVSSVPTEETPGGSLLLVLLNKRHRSILQVFLLGHPGCIIRATTASQVREAVVAII